MIRLDLQTSCHAVCSFENRWQTTCVRLQTGSCWRAGKEWLKMSCNFSADDPKITDHGCAISIEMRLVGGEDGDLNLDTGLKRDRGL